jgi:hypothetical protein
MFKLVMLLSVMVLNLTNVSQAQSIEVTASVDKNPVIIDESFTLSVVANGDVARDAFDSSVLMRDFVVGRTSVSSQTQMINFSTSKSTTWSTTLIPTKEGTYTIPAFTVANAKTQPIELSVIPVTATTTAKGRDLFITTNLDVEQAYLQQQFRYTVKLHLAADLQRGSLSSPTLENADIRQIGKDKEYNEIVAGRRYRIIERSFVIIPQQSGTFTIKGPLFEGEVVDNSRQSFGFFNRSKAISRVGPNQTIEVLPIPSNYSEHWLPSEFVQLDDEWQGSTTGYIAGEPITRTITLTAIGVVEEQLPEIASVYPDSVKTYPDQANTTTVEKDATLIAQRKESIAIIPSQAGELVIPEVKVPWFNSITQKTEYAVLPEKRLQILPAVVQPNNTIPKEASEVKDTVDTPQTLAPLGLDNQQPNGLPNYWMWLTAGFLVVWLTTLGMWFVHVKRLKKRLSANTGSVLRTTQSEQNIWKQLDKALSKNDPQATQTYLGPWLAAFLQDKNASLSQCLTKLHNTNLTQATNSLLAARYAKTKNQWQAQELQQILRKLRKQGRSNQSSEHQLSPLYPTS